MRFIVRTRADAYNLRRSPRNRVCRYIVTYLVLWSNVPVNRGVCRKSFGRFNSIER